MQNSKEKETKAGLKTRLAR